MAEEQPHLVLLGGPNGSGKSTTAPALLAGTLGVQEFVNADVIAQGLSSFRPDRVAMQAGRIMLGRLHELANRRVNFAFESTLASKSFCPWIAGLRQTGYLFHLVFLWLQDPEMAIARVLERVQLGGHDVPAEAIRRRYRIGLRNFFELYQPMADTWRAYDNSNKLGPRLIASGLVGAPPTICDPDTWGLILRAAER